VIFTVTTFLLVTLVVVLSLAPAYNVLHYYNPLSITQDVEYAVNGSEKSSISLPYRVVGLQPGDEVSVFFNTNVKERFNLLLEVDNATCELYLGNSRSRSVGDEGSYPIFQKEPPRIIEIVSLPNAPAGTEIRLSYTLSPIANSLLIKPFYSGDQNLITKHVLMNNYLALILSLMMLVLGVTLAIIGLVFFSRAELAIALFWLGLACIACGIWTFFANNVILLFFSQFSVFYTISYVGLLILPLPLARFCIFYLRPYRIWQFDVGFVVLCVFFAATIASHVTGFVSFGQMHPYFSVIASLLLVIYTVTILRLRQRGRILISPLFIFGIALLTLLTLSETVSSYLGIESPTGTFFMLGLFFATVVFALLVWEYLNDALDALEKNTRLEADISAINRSLDLQRRHFQDFSQSAEETRRMRHDLRHQLVAIKGFIKDGSETEALEYIDRLFKTIPRISEMLICDNVVVNSLAVYYLAQAENEQILCDVKMVVPQVAGRIPDGDLSIIMGNLFENALEACMHVEQDKRFIKVRCNSSAKRLTLVIDNSFDGELQVSGNDFHSRKRKGFGVGIASVRSVVAKYDGSIKIETESGVFKTSLYVKL